MNFQILMLLLLPVERLLFTFTGHVPIIIIFFTHAWPKVAHIGQEAGYVSLKIEYRKSLGLVASGKIFTTCHVLFADCGAEKFPYQQVEVFTIQYISDGLTTTSSSAA